MESKVRVEEYNYVFGRGNPIVLSHAYELSKGNHIAEINIIEVNHNQDSNIVMRKYIDINTLLKRTNNSIEVALDYVIKFLLIDYENILYNENNDLITKPLPLRKNNDTFNNIIIASTPNIDDIKWELNKKSDSKELKEFVNNIIPFELNFKSY